jgi:hypothetical protein
MKNRFSILLIRGCLLVAPFSYAQDEDGGDDGSDTGYSGDANLHVGVTGGYSLMHVNADYSSGTDFRSGYAVGIYGEYFLLGGLLSAQTGLQYHKTGANNVDPDWLALDNLLGNDPSLPGEVRKTNLIFNNLELPVIANVYIGPFTGHIGISNNWYLGSYAQQEKKFEGVPGSSVSRTRIDDRLTGYEFQFVFGGGFKFEMFGLHMTPFFQDRISPSSASNMADEPNFYSNGLIFGGKVGYPLNLNF